MSCSAPAGITLRQARTQEHSAIQALVQAIADETFAHLFPPPVPFGEPDWHAAWLALSRDAIVGVMMTHEEWISDLWVCLDYRRMGVGSLLLAHAEQEIRNQGHRLLRLRVVQSNTRAVAFYQKHGWQVHREFPHEKFGHAMLEMIKPAEGLQQPLQK